MKMGIDDFLAQEAAWPLEAFMGLERIPLTDDRFKAHHAWHQGWEQRQATEELFKNPSAETLDMKEVGGHYSVTFEAYRVRFEFDGLSDARGGVSAELTAHIGNAELLGETDISLKAPTARDTIARTLNGLTSSAKIPWKRLLERACTAVYKAHRRGEPISLLKPSEATHVPFMVNPIIYRGFQTLLYAPGGSLKSWLALYLALLACHGVTQNGIAAVSSPVLYLDWELNAETVGSRLKAIQTGHPELCQHVPYYRRCEQPLHQEANQIASQVAGLGIQILIIDSAAMACGGDLNSPDAAIKLQRALRIINCASLMLAHVSKATPDGQERTAYGTVFFRELARNVWEAERTTGLDGPVRIVLIQKKNNFGPLRAPMALEFQFEGEATRVVSCDPSEEPEFDTKLPLPSRIRNLLEDGSVRSAKEIAAELCASPKSVSVTLSRHKGTKWSQIGENRDAKWTCINR